MVDTKPMPGNTCKSSWTRPTPIIASEPKQLLPESTCNSSSESDSETEVKVIFNGSLSTVYVCILLYIHSPKAMCYQQLMCSLKNLWLSQIMSLKLFSQLSYVIVNCTIKLLLQNSLQTTGSGVTIDHNAVLVPNEVINNINKSQAEMIKKLDKAIALIKGEEKKEEKEQELSDDERFITVRHSCVTYIPYSGYISWC